MENILNKSYKRKNSIDSDTFTVNSIDGEFVVFSNGARCKLTTLLSDFEEINGHISESVTTSSNDINPDTFFETPMSTEDPLLSQLESVATNPQQQIHSERLRESRSLDDGPVTPTHGLNLGNPSQNLNMDTPNDPNMTAQPVQFNEVRLPEWDIFDRVKKSETIEIEVPFKIKLPRPEKIDALNDMFETSFVAYLAKQYIKDNIANNTTTLQITIKEAIETWMEEELYGKKKTIRKRKPTAKKSSQPKKEVVKEESLNITDVTLAKPVDDNSALGFFGGNTSSKWDGNVSKLFIINTKEQYDAVEKRVNQLREDESTSTELDRLEELMYIYNEQIKDLKSE